MKLKQRQWLSLFPTGYASVLLMLLLAIWNPSTPMGHGPVDLLLLLDESESISPEKNNEVWQTFLQYSQKLPEGSRISLIRFADRTVLETPWTSTLDTDFEKLVRRQQPPRHRFLDQGATDISVALKSAIRYTTPDRHTAILISSDGIDNVTTDETAPPIINKNHNLSIFYLKSTEEQLQNPLRIESINLPASTPPGQSLPLSIAMNSANGGRGEIEISLNGRTAINQSLLLQPGETQVLNIYLPSSQADVQHLDFIIRDEQGNVIDQRKRVLASRNSRRLLYIGKQSFSSQADSLQLENWQVTQMHPHRLPSEEAFFSRFNIVILDDLEVNDLNFVLTKNLTRAVELSATGLAVLGGSHSFGNGGYRHSELERILPVTAEASRPLPGAAFLFLLDKSGSMEAAGRSHSRLGDALRAVSESAKSLRPGDESALLVFDREVEILLPLKKHPDTKTALDQPWQLQPSGGTRLVPALEQAIKLLAGSKSQRRFLILVSDGIVGGDDIAPLHISLREADIKIIALAIGNDADLPTLHELTASNGGQVLQVNDTAQLPRFMRQQLEIRQQSWDKTSVTPYTLYQAPFLDEQNSNWLPIFGHQVTRGKPSARVYVATDKGDPLLAVGQHGAGRVAALPGGILETVSGQDFFNRLLTWMDNRQHNPNLKITHSYLSGQLSITVDAVDKNNAWLSATETEIILTSPGGITSSQPLEQIAPGRFAAVLPAPAVGTYNAKINIGNEQTIYTAYLAGDKEHWQYTGASINLLELALSNGDIRYWSDASLDNLLDSSSGRFSTRTLWLLLALVIYLCMITIERSSGLNTLISSFKSLKPQRHT